MTTTTFISAVLALLLAPGPTNTLMGLAGAQRGLRGVARLLPAELFGYLTTILPLIYLGSEVLGRWPVAAVILKVAAALWVMFLAINLWGRNSVTGASSDVTARRVLSDHDAEPQGVDFWPRSSSRA